MLKNSSRAMLGYDYQGYQFTPNEHAATVKSIFDMFVGGESLTQIANHLNRSGVATARGGKWQPPTVRYILSNGFYAGVSRWDGVEVPGTHTAIVDAITYEAACAKVMATKPGPQLKGADQGLQNACSDYVKL